MLTRIWDFLFHRHKWVILEKGALASVGQPSGFVSKGIRIILQCSECGDVKKKDLI